MKIVPLKSGTASFYVKLNTGTKHFLINDSEGNVVTEYANNTAASLYVKVDAAVEKGKTYYAYTEASGTDYFGISFEPGVETTPTPSPEPEPAEASVWTAKASDGTAIEADSKGNTALVPAGKNLSASADFELYVMEELAYKDVDVSFIDMNGIAIPKPDGMTGRLTKKPSGGTNPTRPTFGATGASMKIVPLKSGKASFYVKVNSGTKHFLVNDSEGNIVTEYANDSAASQYVKIDAAVEKGKTYYAYTEASGTDYFAVAFNPGSETTPSEPTAMPTAAPTATPGPVVGSDLPPVTEDTTWKAEDFASTDVTSTVVVGEGANLKIYGTSKMAIGGSNKSFGQRKYTTRLKLGGTGQFASTGAPTGQVVEFLPGKGGNLTVDFAHASSSGDERALSISQGGYVISETRVAAGGAGTAEIYVNPNYPVYIYSTLGAVNLYGIMFEVSAPTPEPTATPDPAITPDPSATATPLPTNAPGPDLDAAQADYDALTLKSISDYAVYFDLDLAKNGANGSKITWESSDERYIKITENSSTNLASSGVYRNYTGEVTRPMTDEECAENGGVPVTLTATIKKGNAVLQKVFNVSVRKFNPYYYNDFQDDIGAEPDPDNKYYGIQDNVVAANGDKFRGIRVTSFANSKAMKGFKHSDEDLEKNFDKRVMSTDAKYGKPYSIDGTQPDENFAFYYSEWNMYGGNTTYMPLWISLADENGSYPEGLVVLNMDLFVITPRQQFSIGIGTSKPAQMCRFMLNAGNANTNLGYNAGGTLRYFDSEEALDYQTYKEGSTTYKNYLVPTGKWVTATIVANSSSHLWDFYFDGLQVAHQIKFRNAEDFIPTIEFTLARSYQEGSYLIDNISVENITEDFAGSYWDDLKLGMIPYDEETDVYTIDKASVLPYNGTGGLSGNRYTWTTSDPNTLNIATKSVAVEDLGQYGFTDEQIENYKNNNANYVTVVVAEPSEKLPAEGKYVTITAAMEVDDIIYSKDFKILVKPTGAGAETDLAKAKADLAAITGVTNGMTVSTSKYLTLDEKGSVYGSAITWETSNKSLINTDGYVSIPSSSQSVVLTATAVYGEATATKKFTINLKGSKTSGGGGGGGGGSSSSASRVVGTISTPTETFETQAYTPEQTSEMIFNDIDHVAWAKDAIEALYEKGVVSGYGNGLFAPDYSVTREQFIKMLVTALKLDTNIVAETSFTDVADDAWYAPYINAATVLGITTGKDDGSFGVGESITRQDMAVMCVRALTVAGMAPAEAAPVFGDSNSISDYAQSSVGSMAGAGYLTGDENGNFNPLNTATRAQTAVVLYRIINK